MIDAHQRPEETTTTAENSCHWLAEATIDGRTYTARSRRGAPHELARLLVSAGVPDQPMRVYSAGLAGYAAYPSLHKAAGFTIEEGRDRLSRVRWRDLSHQAWAGKGGERPVGGVEAPAVLPW